MTRLVRGAAAAMVALVIAVLAGAPAVAGSNDPVGGTGSSSSASPSADPTFGCLGATTSYGAALPCQLNVNVLQPVCDNDVPYLRYAVEAVGSPNTTVTITWINAAHPGKSVVYANLPLSGRVLWPGAVVDKSGNALDWPGWTKKADGTWVEGDQFDWVRPSVKVHFKVNPEATVTVGYPPSTPQCNDNPPSSQVLADGGAVLAATGSNDVKPLAFAAAGLVVVGALAVVLALVTRRRRRDA